MRQVNLFPPAARSNVNGVSVIGNLNEMSESEDSNEEQKDEVKELSPKGLKQVKYDHVLPPEFVMIETEQPQFANEEVV